MILRKFFENITAFFFSLNSNFELSNYSYGYKIKGFMVKIVISLSSKFLWTNNFIYVSIYFKNWHISLIIIIQFITIRNKVNRSNSTITYDWVHLILDFNEPKVNINQ